MKKLICLMMALALLSVGALAETATYTDADDALSFQFDKSAFEIDMDDSTETEHLVILSGTREDWGEYYVRLYTRLMEEGDQYPTREDFADIEEELNAEITEGEWNGFQNVIMYEAHDDKYLEMMFSAPLVDRDMILVVYVGANQLEDEEAAMARDDLISAVVDSIEIGES